MDVVISVAVSRGHNSRFLQYPAPFHAYPEGRMETSSQELAGAGVPQSCPASQRFAVSAADSLARTYLLILELSSHRSFEKPGDVFMDRMGSSDQLKTHLVQDDVCTTAWCACSSHVA